MRNFSSKFRGTLFFCILPVPYRGDTGRKENIYMNLSITTFNIYTFPLSLFFSGTMPTCIKPSLFRISRASHVHTRLFSFSLLLSRCARCLTQSKEENHYYSQLQPPSPSPLSLPPPPALATTTTTTTITTLSVIPPSTLILSATARAIFFTRARWWKSQRNFSAAAASSWRGIIQIRSRARAAYAISHDATRQDKTRHDTTRRTQCHRRITRISLSVLDQSSAEIRARAYLVAANELASRVRAREKLFCRLLWLHLVVNREQCGVSSLSSASTSTSTSSSRGFAARCIAGCCAATTTGREPRRLLRKEPVKDRRRNTLAGECKRSVCCGGIRVSHVETRSSRICLEAQYSLTDGSRRRETHCILRKIS